jgi:glutathione S-transferase
LNNYTDLEILTVNYFTAEHKGLEYLKINPMGTVPSAIDDDCTITESNAILQYAADHSDNPQYYPKDLKHRANVNRWLLWEASVWFPSCYVYLVEYVVKPLLKAEPDQSIIDAEAPKWNQLAAVLETQLTKTKWLAGDEVTIADSSYPFLFIFMSCYISRSSEEFSAWPHFSEPRSALSNCLEVTLTP